MKDKFIRKQIKDFLLFLIEETLTGIPSRTNVLEIEKVVLAYIILAKGTDVKNITSTIETQIINNISEIVENYFVIPITTDENSIIIVIVN